MKTKRERAIEAEDRAGRFLANANEAAERGDQAEADKLYEKSQFWLDRYTKGHSD
jgi:hypothetical protein